MGLHVTIDSSAQYPAFRQSATLPNSYPKAYVPSRDAVCTILMTCMYEPITYTYSMRGGHANHKAVLKIVKVINNLLLEPFPYFHSR